DVESDISLLDGVGDRLHIGALVHFQPFVKIAFDLLLPVFSESVMIDFRFLFCCGELRLTFSPETAFRLLPLFPSLPIGVDDPILPCASALSKTGHLVQSS